MAREGQTVNEVIRLLGRAGRLGGLIALGLAALFGGSGGYLLSLRMSGGGSEWFFVAPLALVVGGAFGLTGLYLLVTGGGVFAADPRFAPLTVGQVVEKMAQQPRPFFVCVDCKVVLPFEVAVGRCPRCNSSSACLEVANDDDAKTVRAALGV